MRTRNIVLTGLFLAFGILLPLAFHVLGVGGQVFLPMHIPVLLAGIFLGPLAGAVVGGISPLLSHLFTGMPPLLPMLPIMLVELPAYGMVAGFLHRRLGLSVWMSLIGSLLAGRVAVGGVVWIMATYFGFSRLNPWLFVVGGVVTGLPGIVIQLALIPPLIGYLKRMVTVGPGSGTD